jgi:hypothetical protein
VNPDMQEYRVELPLSNPSDIHIVFGISGGRVQDISKIIIIIIKPPQMITCIWVVYTMMFNFTRR